MYLVIKLEWKSNLWQHVKHTLYTLLHRYAYATRSFCILWECKCKNKCAIDFYTVSVRWKHADRTLRTRYQHAEGSWWNWHILCPPTSAYCGRSVSVRLPRRGRAERSHSVCIACSLRTGCTSAYPDNLCACIKFLGVWNELRHPSAYDNVIWTLPQPSPDVLPTCISIWQHMTKSRHTQSS